MGNIIVKILHQLEKINKKFMYNMEIKGKIEGKNGIIWKVQKSCLS